MLYKGNIQTVKEKLLASSIAEMGQGVGVGRSNRRIGRYSLGNLSERNKKKNGK